MTRKHLQLHFRADPMLQIPRILEPASGTPTEAELLRDLVTAKAAKALMAAGEGRFTGNGPMGVAFDEASTIFSIFEVDDFDRAEAIVRTVIDMTEYMGKVDICHWVEDHHETDQIAPFKSIEVYYNIADIPARYADPLDFRNEAMDLMEQALEEAGAGEWSGAEIGMGEVNFGFTVEDFERAEKIVRATVKGTPFEGIREITRITLP